MINKFFSIGQANTASFYVGQTLGNWNETLAPFKKASNPGAVYQGIDTDNVQGENYIITLPAHQIHSAAYLSVFSKREGVLGHVVFNGAGNIFRSGSMMIVLASSLVMSYLLH